MIQCLQALLFQAQLTLGLPAESLFILREIVPEKNVGFYGNQINQKQRYEYDNWRACVIGWVKRTVTACSGYPERTVGVTPDMEWGAEAVQ